MEAGDHGLVFSRALQHAVLVLKLDGAIVILLTQLVEGDTVSGTSIKDSHVI